MTRILTLTAQLAIALALLALPVAASLAAENSPAEVNVEEAPPEELTIKEIMRQTMTKGLCQKVIKKKATQEEQQELVRLFTKLAELDPEIGDADNWQDRCDELVKYSTEISLGEESHKNLKKAANCIDCHKEHRPK